MSFTQRVNCSNFISLTSCHVGSTDIPDPLSPLFPIVHRLRQSSGQHLVSSYSC